jgi:3',5'-cyclic-AMP phosphodiesterase
MTHHSPEHSRCLQWASDIHLDKADSTTIAAFKQRLATVPSSGLVISGDISRSDRIVADLAEIAVIVAPQPVFFVAGNHDYHGSSMAAVRRALDTACARHRNLHHLTQRGMIRIDRNTVIMGHEGWADGCAGRGSRSDVSSRDRYAIADFRGHSDYKYFRHIRELGDQSARHLRKLLPYALKISPRVLIVTHAPPFIQATCFDGARCDNDHLPHFANVAAGKVIGGIAKQFSRRSIEVLAGHTHCGADLRIAPNLKIRVASVIKGRPGLQTPIALE